ncbi:hypothetical protein [Frigoriflavimonas asaccharolytica]|uniref:Outer membrane beta-barrel porin/alpha-amylase n=1 Tax=Frigoriflavimonas asaccharolytica TaxID=2735899 RepID=A0A8J8GAE8_9FLAO|nr:hypothetical protein [Frigoriflavimonas asaccharolytica]NRS92952.1 hypothetical protein [Frigoriflavimonas asaccharolytica]
MKNKITLTLFLLGFIFISAQSPWTRDQGKAFVQVGVTGLFYDSFQYDGSEVNIGADVSDITTQIYAEYGLAKNLEALVMIPYKSISVKNGSNSESISGLGNVSVGLKYKISDKTWKISTGAIYSANSIKIDENIGLSTGFNASTFLPYVTVGSSKNKWYYFGNIGYGYMTNDYSDFFKASLEVGYEIIKDGHLIFLLDTKNVVNKENAFINDTAQWPSYLDRQTYNAIGIKGNYEFQKDKFGANLGVIGATGIDNAPLAPTINFGVYAKF